MQNEIVRMSSARRAIAMAPNVAQLSTKIWSIQMPPALIGGCGRGAIKTPSDMEH
jgi:hypothetical protein